ncbi:hypothetical protein H9P43_006601 [Blastocladiella emersonii ATCC 22665]|nr:hypothetical protein H9P43_006601 [Blastocladiella emersonii ATCC 22665]
MPNSAAVCIGLSYPTTHSPLPGAAVDANTMSSVAAGMGMEDIQTITDADAPVTREQVLGSLRDLVQGAESGDTLLFSFSGRGTTVADTNSDETAGGKFDEAIQCADGVVTDDEIRAVLGDLPEGANLIMAFDSTSSGSMADLDLAGAEIPGNVVVLSSCAADGTEVAQSSAAGGAFTNALAEVLAANPGITWSDAAALMDQADGNSGQTASVAANRAELLFEPAFAPVEDVARDANADAESATMGGASAVGSAIAVETINGNEVTIERFESGAEIRKAYTDGDGVANVVAYVSADGSTTIEADRTGDGSQDFSARIGADGTVTMAAYDVDGDGYYETQLHTAEDGSTTVGVYDRDGNMVQNLDTDGDGIVDVKADANGDGIHDIGPGLDLAAMTLDGAATVGLGESPYGDGCC